MEKKVFAERLAALRIQKGVSAREMSLAIGQSPGYINNIENGINLPSMAAFLYICDYLHISPGEFFDQENETPDKHRELTVMLKRLNSRQLDIMKDLVCELLRNYSNGGY